MRYGLLRFILWQDTPPVPGKKEANWILMYNHALLLLQVGE